MQRIRRGGIGLIDSLGLSSRWGLKDKARPCGVAESQVRMRVRLDATNRLANITAAWAALRRGVWAGIACGLLAAGLLIPTIAAATAAEQVGSASGLPVPRYVSLKSDKVNLREGPSRDHRTTWIFERAGLPVEITAEFETWRKVRDSEGSEGWVLHSLLSGRRTALVTPWKKDGPPITVYAKPNEGSNPVARLAPNVLANVRSCDKVWCRVNGEGFDGFIHQGDLWGVYPNEVIE